MAAGEMSRPAFSLFLATSLRHLAGFSAGGVLIYVCVDWRLIINLPPRHLKSLLTLDRVSGLVLGPRPLGSATVRQLRPRISPTSSRAIG